jgi:Flp pilus assembly pilin Flp
LCHSPPRFSIGI